MNRLLSRFRPIVFNGVRLSLSSLGGVVCLAGSVLLNPVHAQDVDFPEMQNRTSQHLSGLANNSEAKSVELGDFNNDGWEDLVVTTRNQNSVLLINNGGVLTNRNNQFLPSADQTSNSNYAEAFDANSDGWTDIVFARLGNAPRLYMNQGDDGNGNWQGFDSGTDLAGASDILVIESGDITGDGAPDLFVIQVQDATNRLLVNDGNGNFSPNNGLLGSLGNLPRGHAALLDDVDSDGDIDVVYIEADLFLYIYYNDGNGNLGNRHTFRNGDAFAYIFGAGDFNGDGIYDYRQYSNSDPRAQMSNGQIDGGRPGYTVRQDGPMLRGNRKHGFVHVRDIDGDGDLDYVLSSISRSSGSLEEFFEGMRTEMVFNEGFNTGNFVTFVGDAWGQEESYDMKIVDINNDGNMDMFVAHAQRWGVYINQASPLVARVISVQTTAAEAGTAATLNANVDFGGNVTYEWDMGDGTILNTDQNSASHVYAQPGRYQVIVTATGDDGSSDQKIVQQRVHETLMSEAPVSSMSVVYEARADGDRLYVANPDNDQVTVVDAATGNVLAEIAVGDEPRSLALDSPGTLCVVNKGDATVTRIDTNSLSAVGTLSLPRASRPHGIVFDENKTYAFIALEAAGKVLKVDFSSGQIVDETDTGPFPRELALHSSGARLLAPRFISSPTADEHTRNPAPGGGEVIVINTDDMSIETTISVPYHSPENDIDTNIENRGIPNYLRAPAMSPNGYIAIVPSKVDNIYRGSMRDGNAREHDTLVRGMLSTVDFWAAAEQLDNRFHFDNNSQPTAVAFGPTGNYLYVVHEASRAYEVFDYYSGEIIFSGEVEFAPTGIAVSPDGTRVYVHNWLSRSLSIIDSSSLMDGSSDNADVIDTVSLVSNESLSDQVLLGKRLFHDSKDPRLSGQKYISCATCHDDAGHDGRVWDFSDAGEGLRNTIDLRGRSGIGHGNVHWSANFDEFHDFENDIREIFDGTGLLSDIDFNDSRAPLDAFTPKAGRSGDLDALAAYAASLAPLGDSPYRNANGSLTDAAVRGREIFRTADCALCHSGSRFTDSPNDIGHNIGTVDSDTGGRLGQPLLDGGLDTPTLRGLWHGAPYLHDGSAQTIQDAVTAHSSGMNFNVASLSNTELNDLAAYLLQIDDAETVASSINDFDGDGISNSVDPDDDNDGVDDINDAFPDDPSESADSDGDGVGDNVDALPNDASEQFDSDNDGVGDNRDRFPLNSSETRDSDGDGVGDNADIDADNDGIPDEVEEGTGLDFAIGRLLSTSRSNFETADAGEWVSVTRAEYDALASDLDEVSRFGTQEGNMQTGAFGNWDDTQTYTFGHTNNPSPANVNFVAFKRGTGIASRDNNDIVRVSSNNNGQGFAAVGAPLPNGAVDGNEEFFVLKGSEENVYSQPMYLGLSTDDSNPIYFEATGTSGRWATGSVQNIGSGGFGWSMQGLAVAELQNNDFAEYDADSDGVPNVRDLDSDNDAIPDVIEAGGIDADNDGRIDQAQSNQGSLTDPADSDGNGIPDYIDPNNNPVFSSPITDSDNDGWDDSVDSVDESPAPVLPVDPPEPVDPNPSQSESYNPSSSMAVDGDFTDWNDIVAYAGDPDDISGNNNTLDFARGVIAHDDDNVYFRYDNHAPDDLQLSWGMSIQIDTDSNPNTGFRGFGNEFPIGVDYMIEANTLHRYTGSGNDFSWDAGTIVATAFSGASLELAVARSAIGDPQSMRLFYYANNTAVDGTALDYYPDATADLNAPLASRSFAYLLGDESVTPVVIDPPASPQPLTPLSGIYNPVSITVDGDLSDWSDATSFGADPNDASGDGNVIDWREGWMAHDSNNFYIGWVNDEATQISWGNGIMIDSDRNRATGFTGFGNELPIGVDYLIESDTIHRYTGAGTDWAWADGGSSTIVFAGNNAELTVTRAALGNPQALDVFFSGNNNATGGNVIDYYPDTAGVSSAPRDTRFFTYSTVQPDELPDPVDPVAPEQNIVINGNLSDWPADAVTASDAADMTAPDFIDWRELRVLSDASNVYVAYQGYNTLFSGALDGSQSVPSVTSSATGTMALALNTDTGELSGSIDHDVANATMAHIHEGASGQTGDVIVTLSAFGADQYRVPDGTVLSTDQIAAFVAGNLYINIHSSSNPSGEIRAQTGTLTGPLWGEAVMFDTDGNSNTGFKGFGNELPLGVELMVEGRVLQQYTGASQNEWSWEVIEEVSYARDGNLTEIAIERSRFGDTNNIGVILRGDNSALSGSGIDYLPDSDSVSLNVQPLLQGDEPSMQSALPASTSKSSGGGSLGLSWLLLLPLMLSKRVLQNSRAKLAAIVTGASLMLAACGDGGQVLGTGGPDNNATPGTPNINVTPSTPSNNPSLSQITQSSSAQSNPSFANALPLLEADGTQVVPPVATRAGASVDMVLNTQTGALSGSVNHSVSNATGATVRLGGIGINGAELIALTETQPGKFVVPQGTLLSSEQVTAFNNGEMYIVVASAAHPDGEVRSQLSSEPVDIAVQPNLDDIQAKVFSPVCSGCHSGGGQSLPGIMDLSNADASYGNLVNTPSQQQTELDRVSANDADSSYLIMKLEGTQSTGSQMPFRGTPLDTAVVDAIRGWINTGAAR